MRDEPWMMPKDSKSYVYLSLQEYDERTEYRSRCMELLKENSRLKEALLSHMFISYATSTKISDRFVDVGELRSLGFSDVELQTYIEVHKDE